MQSSEIGGIRTTCGDPRLYQRDYREQEAEEEFEVAAAKIISSPWCRCLETARLMDLGSVAVDSSFSNAFVLADQREELKQRGSAVISAWPSGNLLVVTHGANITALSGQQLAPAETLVLEPGGTPLRIIGRIPPPM